MKDTLQYSTIFMGSSKRYIIKAVIDNSSLSKILSESESEYFNLLNDSERLEWLKSPLEVPEIILEGNETHKYQVTYKTSPTTSKTIVTSASDETELYQRYKNRDIVSIKEIGKKVKRNLPVVESLDKSFQGFKKFIKNLK